jgi:auxin response factor
LQGQEIPLTVPMFQGMVSDACLAKGGYGLHNYMRDSCAMSLELASATQGYALSLSTPPPAEVASPSPTLVPQLWLASKNNEEGANDIHPNPLGIRKAPGDGAKLGSDGRKVARTSCMLFGFSLTEKMMPTEEDRVKEGNHETDHQNPRMLDLFGYSHATPGALHALCAAPLGM